MAHHASLVSRINIGTAHRRSAKTIVPLVIFTLQIRAAGGVLLIFETDYSAVAAEGTKNGISCRQAVSRCAPRASIIMENIAVAVSQISILTSLSGSAQIIALWTCIM